MKLLNLNLLKLTALAATIIFPLSNAYTSDREREGGMHGGGGNSVVCFQEKDGIPGKVTADAVRRRGFVLDEEIKRISKIVTFDLWEAQEEIIREDGTVFTPKIIPIGSNETWQDYVKKIAKRYEFWIPELSEMILKSINTFEQRNIAFKNVPLKNLDDTNRPSELAVEECTLVTVARQDKIGGVRSVQFDHRLTNNAKNEKLSLAVLRLHEIVYAQAREYGQTDSKNTRIFVGHFITANNHFTIREMIKEMTRLGFAPRGDSTSLDAITFNSFSPVIAEIGKIKKELTEKTELAVDAYLEPYKNYLLDLQTRTNIFLNEIEKDFPRHRIVYCYTEVTFSSVSHCSWILTKGIPEFYVEKGKTMSPESEKKLKALAAEFQPFRSHLAEISLARLRDAYQNEFRAKIAAIVKTPKTMELIEEIILSEFKNFNTAYKNYDGNYLASISLGLLDLKID